MATLIRVGNRMMTAQQVRNTYRWRRLRAEICRPGSVCSRCGQPIRFGLRRGHPLGPSVDHIVPLDKGGAPFDPANLTPMHFGCNSAKQSRVVRQSASW